MTYSNALWVTLGFQFNFQVAQEILQADMYKWKFPSPFPV